ncbi:MAG TPA: alanine racemase C-terminal domain-containing protein [Microbacterium sp.]|nr:alanine racemase C-terminal domain-containing protein [Microbacterium sp.]
MTLGIPGRAAPGSAAPGRTALTARISLSALKVNLRAVLATTRTGLIDLRADAWGHGVEVVARSAVSAGADRLLIDEADAAALAGIVDPARLGLAGSSTSPEAVYGLTAGFEPVLSLRGRVLSLKSLKEGEGVSYGYTHRAAHDTRVALVTGGYAQGVVRALGNAASVQIAGERHPIVGRVAMDVCVVDVGPGDHVQRGAEVVFFGGEGPTSPSLAEWSAATGMTAAELVTAVGLRNAREYVR